MFTGIIEALGTVKNFDGETLAIEIPASWKRVQIGSSIAVHGACLTVVKQKGRRLFFNVIGETRARTVLGRLRPGDRVNLERAMRYGDRFEGHMVLGHVDGAGTIARISRSGKQTSFLVRAPKNLRKFLVEKGSVAVNGVSLTLGRVRPAGFWVHLIPHTLEVTQLGRLKMGDNVNLEADILAKLA